MTKTKKESRGGGEGVKRRPCFSANDWRQAQEEQRLIDLLLEIPPSDHLPSFLVYKISSILLDSPERDAELVQVELMDLAMLVTSGPDLSEAQRLMALSLFHDLLFLSWLKTVSTQPTLPSSSALWCVDQLAEASRWTLNTKVYSNLVLALKLERLCLEALTLASCVFPREDNEAGSGDFVAMLVEEQPYLAIGMLAEWPPTLSDGSKAIKTSILSIKAFVSLLKALSLLPSLDDDDETESAASRDGDPMGDERARCLTSISYIALDPLTNVPQLKELCLICLERYLCDWQSSLSSSTPSGLILLHEAIEQLMGLLDDPQGTLKEVGMPSKTRVKCRVLLWKASALTPPPSLATPLSAAVADPVLESILKSPLLLPSPSLSLPSFLPHQWTLLPATQIKEPLNVSSSIIPVSLSFESGLYSASYWSVRVSSWVVAILTPGLPLPAPWTSLYPPLPSPDALIDKDVGSKDDDDEDEDEEDELQMRHESSLAVRDEVDECLGPNPYSPLALTLALLELITSLLLIDGLDGSLLPLLAHMASSSSSLMIDPVQQRALLRAVSCIPRLANSIPIFLSSKTGSDFDFTNHAVKLAVSLSNHMAAAHEMERSQGIAMSRDKALGMEGAREVSQLLPLAMFFPNILIQRLVQDAVYRSGHQALVISLLNNQLHPICSSGNHQEKCNLVHQSLLSLLLPHASSSHSSSIDSQPLSYPSFSPADQSSFISLCKDLSLTLSSIVHHVALPFMGTWTNEASRRGGTSQLHTCLQVITCWLNDHLKEALETYYYPHLSDQVNALLAVSQCLVKLWSRAEGDNAALFDPEGIDLCAELIGRMACSLRKATIKVWADMRRLSDDVKSVPVEIVGFCHDLHRLLYELCLNLPSQDVPDTPIPSNTEMEGSKRVLQMLLPALEAPLSIPPPFHLQLAEQEAKATWQSVEEWEITAKRLKSLIQPSIQLKHSKQRSASSQLPAEGHAAASGDDDEQQVDGVVKMLWWSCSDDGHAKIMTDLILSSIKSESEEEEEEDMNRKEEKSDEDDLSLLRTAARGISGPVFRAIDRLISSVSHPSLGNLLSSSLSLILPYCSINQSKRLLGIVIPSLIATYADQEAEQWWSGKSVIASTGFSIHVLFRSLPLAVSSAVDQGQKQAIMDRCLSLLSSHLKKNLVISDMSSWSLVLTALNESLICHQSLLSIPSTDAGYNKEDESLSFDFGALLALALSFVQVLCSPPLSLFTSTDGFKALVKQVVDVLQGRVARDEKAHAFVEQVAMAGSRTADDYWQGIVSKGEIEDIAVESWTLLDNLFLLIQ